MDECISVLEGLFQEEAGGLVENIARQRFRFAKGFANYMGGVLRGTGVYGLRHNSVTLLYNIENGKLDAVLEPGNIAWIRTGAATGVAVKYMSKPDASVVGLFGTGRQAITQLEAVCAVRDVKLVKVYSRSEENRRKFASDMKERLGVNIEPVATPGAAVKGSQIVVVITTAREPVFDGALLEPGTHVTAAGSNSAFKREIDETTIQRASLVAIDNIEQAKMECGELIQAADRGLFLWNQAHSLSDVVGGKVPGRPSEDAITLFESQGVGIEDIACSAYVLQKARAQGIGVELPF
jgi:ornithine cyclodeaminase/alanine dehydrogenase-like protein (mu-crystallin family)